MIIDGIQLVEGSTLSNATVASGASYPSSPTLGELFYKTGAGVGFYVYDGSAWVSAGGGGGLSSPVGIADGGTGQTTASAAINALLPAQAAQAGKYLTTNGSVASWGTVAGGGGTAAALAGTGNAGATISTSAVYAGMNGTFPLIDFINASAATNLKRAQMYVNNSGAFKIDFVTDAGTSTTAFQMNNTAGAPSATTITSAQIDLVGLSAGLRINGTAGVAGQVLTSAGSGAAPTWSNGTGPQLSTSNTYTKAQIVSPSILTSGSTVSVDASLSNNFRLVLGTAATLANPTNLVNGQVFNIVIIQDATGGRTLAYGNKYKFVGGVAPTLSTAANAVDILGCYYDGTLDLIFANLNKSYA